MIRSIANALGTVLAAIGAVWIVFCFFAFCSLLGFTLAKVLP